MKKKFFTYTMCFCICSSSFSQNISLERSLQPDYFTELNAFIYDSSDATYILGGNYWDVNTGFFSPAYLSKTDSSGSLSWFNDFIVSGEVCNVYNVVYSNDSNFIVSGYDREGCDFGGDFGFVQKISPQGSVIWTKTFYPQFINSFYNFGRSLAYLSNHTVRLSVDSNVYSLDNLGDSVTSYTYHYGKINQIEKTPDHFLLLACDSGMLRTDTSGNIISSSSFFKKNRNIVVKNSNEYIFNADKIIYKTDSIFNILNQVDLQTSVDEIKKIKKDSSLFWVLSESTAGFSEMIKLDDTLAINSTCSYNSFNGTDFDVNNFIVHQNNYVLGGYEHTPSNSHVFIKSFDKANNTSFSYQKDVGVISLRADSSYATYINGSPNLYYVYLDIYATVKNFGNTPLSNVHLNSLISSFMGICLPYAYWETFNGLNLAPGDSTEFHIGWVTDIPPGFSPQNNNYTLCIWTSSPDEKMDVDHSNDKFCHTFTITTFTGIEEFENNSQINISPNPCKDYLEIEFNSVSNKKTELIIFNMYGQKMKSCFLFNEKQKIDVSEFASGIYFLEFSMNNKTVNKKIIKL